MGVTARQAEREPLSALKEANRVAAITSAHRTTTVPVEAEGHPHSIPILQTLSRSSRWSRYLEGLLHGPKFAGGSTSGSAQTRQRARHKISGEKEVAPQVQPSSKHAGENGETSRSG